MFERPGKKKERNLSEPIRNLAKYSQQEYLTLYSILEFRVLNFTVP